MKLKLTLLSAFIVFCFTVKAQTQLSNEGFETWSQTANPDGWGDWESINPLVPNNFTFKDTSRVEGSYSVRLETDTATLPGSSIALLRAAILSAGSASINSNLAYQPTAVDFTGRPDTLFFSYKYTTPGTDTAIVFIALGSNDTTILSVEFLLTPSATWKNSYALLSSYYQNGSTPQAMILEFASSNLQPILGSTLNVDAVHFGYSTVSGVNNIKNEINLKVYPNPVSTELNIRADKNLMGSAVQIYNINGQLVSSEVLEGNSNTINLSSLSCGTYIYKITDSQNNVIDVNKISVAK